MTSPQTSHQLYQGSRDAAISAKRSREDEKMRLIEDSTHSVTFQRIHVVKPEINNSKRCPKMEAGSVIGRNTIHGNRSTPKRRNIPTTYSHFITQKHPSNEVRHAIYARKRRSRETETEHKNSRAIEMSAEVTSGGRSLKSTPLPSSLTSTKVKEVWERFADGVGMGRRRWALPGSTEAGFVDSEDVLPEGGREEGRRGEAGRCARTGVET